MAEGAVGHSRHGGEGKRAVELEGADTHIEKPGKSVLATEGTELTEKNATFLIAPTLQRGSAILPLWRLIRLWATLERGNDT